MHYRDPDRKCVLLGGQRKDITVVIVDDENLSLQLREDLQPVAEVALKVVENLRGAIYDEERQRRGVFFLPRAR